MITNFKLFEKLNPNILEELKKCLDKYIESDSYGSKPDKKLGLPITYNDYYDSEDFAPEEFFGIYGWKNDDKTYNNDNYWKGIRSPFSILSTLKELKNLSVLQNKTPKLCDMGCGIGNILRFCEKIGFDCYGIELLDEYKKYHKGLKIKYGDFFDMNLSFLKNMDIVYLYRPIKNDELMKKLMDIVYENTNDDVIILFFHTPNFLVEDEKWKNVCINGYGGNICFFIKN